MAYSAQTAHYGLPLPIGSDRSTFMDQNEAFSAVDTALYNAVTAGAETEQEVQDLNTEITGIQSTIAGIQTDVGALQNGLASTNLLVQEHADDITALETATNGLSTSKQDATDNNLDTTDKTVVGAINELNDKLNANNRSSETNITSYDSSNPYVAPSDGYVQLRCVGTGSAGQIEVDDANGNYLAQLMISTDAGNGIQSLFVKKGMKIYYIYLAGDTGVSFRGLN